MPLLGIDVDAARNLQQRLARSAREASDLVPVVAHSLALAELDGSGGTETRLLDQLAECASMAAVAVGNATDLIEAFVLPPVAAGPDTPTPVTDRRWHQVRQLADHNTYEHGTIADQQLAGRYAHELDLHVGAPTDFSVAATAAAWPATGLLIYDAVTDAGSHVGDWHVYHSSLDPHSTYDTLGRALDDVAAGSGAVPVTVFLDLKDPLDGDHDPATLDTLLRDRLGDRLFTPADLATRAPEQPSLAAAVLVAGWPRATELGQQVMVVLTGSVDAYRNHSVDEAAAFVAVAPDSDALRDPNVVIYNAHVDRIDPVQIAAIKSTHGLLRVWGAHDPDESDATRAANWIAVD